MTKTPVRRRRRGEQLENELLDTAWEVLGELGFPNLTIEAVAARACTGIAVLYRRWANKNELALAAIEYYCKSHPIEVPNTGSLRDDLLTALTSVGETRAAFISILAATAFSGLTANTGLTLTQMEERVIREQGIPPVWTIYRRAHDRGEIDLDRIPFAVLAMPFHLVGYYLITDLKPLERARIQSIVDEMFLPLVSIRKEQRKTKATATGNT